MTQLLPFVLFAFVASITPGPTNVIILGTSARHGWLAGVPIALGACVGAVLIILAVGLGLGEWLLSYPSIQQAMAWCAVAWLSWLAWQIARSPAEAIEANGQVRRLGFAGAAGLQVVNPKTWMMALAVVAVFAGQGSEPSRYLLLATLFFAVSIPCLLAWAALGAGAARILRSPQHVQWFNRCMAMALLISAWLGLLG